MERIKRGGHGWLERPPGQFVLEPEGTREALEGFQNAVVRPEFCNMNSTNKPGIERGHLR